MRKNVWILNHYATGMLFSGGGRHFWMAEQLVKDGYTPVVFGCNAKTDRKELFFPGDALWQETTTDNGVKFVAVKSSLYQGNGVSRVKNMVNFALNLLKTAKEYAKKYGKPDVIYASSVHPLTVLAGERIARHFRVPCIGEVRDLWPETLVAYGALRRNSLPAKLLYAGEKWMYKRADAMIFTMEGAPDYIREHRWDKAQGGPIDLNRVYHINNGVDLEQFDRNVEAFVYADPDLDDPGTFCAVYTGSVRRANNLGLLLDALAYLKDLEHFKILIWGQGYEIEKLKARAEERGEADRFVFKGFVDKKYIPSIVTKSDCNLMHWERTSVNNYGYDYNKLFEYLAAGRPIFSTIQSGHSLLVNKNCGIETDGPTPKDFADGIRKIYQMSPEERDEWGRRARIAASDYDFKVQTKVLEKIIESV